VFVLDKPFQLSISFVGKAGAYPKSGAIELHSGRLLALHKKIRTGLELGRDC